MAMPEEPSFRVQTEELCMTVSRLATAIGEIREAFVRQKTLPDKNVPKQMHFTFAGSKIDLFRAPLMINNHGRMRREISHDRTIQGDARCLVGG